MAVQTTEARPAGSGSRLGSLLGNLPQIRQATIGIIVVVLFVGAVIALMDVVLQQVLVRWIPSLFAGR